MPAPTNETRVLRSNFSSKLVMSPPRYSAVPRTSEMGVNSVRKIGNTPAIASSLNTLPSNAVSVFLARDGIAATPP